MGSSGAVSITLDVIAWCVILILFVVLYRKQENTPKVWKAFIVLLIGMISFTFEYIIFETKISIPVIPIGLGALFLILNNRNDYWKTYQPYAWLGFLALFIFIISTLLASPIQKFFYPSDELSTFITDAEEAQVVSIHPSGNEVELIHLANQLEQLEQQEIKSEQWYRDMTVRKENHEIEERFPYVLTNTSPKSGSGFNGVIYLERDGKGILVTTKDRQYYFRSNESLLKEGADE